MGQSYTRLVLAMPETYQRASSKSCARSSAEGHSAGATTCCSTRSVATAKPWMGSSLEDNRRAPVSKAKGSKARAAAGGVFISKPARARRTLPQTSPPPPPPRRTAPSSRPGPPLWLAPHCAPHHPKHHHGMAIGSFAPAWHGHCAAFCAPGRRGTVGPPRPLDGTEGRGRGVHCPELPERLCKGQSSERSLQHPTMHLFAAATHPPATRRAVGGRLCGGGGGGWRRWGGVQWWARGAWDVGAPSQPRICQPT